MKIREIGIALAAAATLAGCSWHVNADVTTPQSSFTTDSTTVQMTSAFVGTNVYIPSTVAVVAGRPYTLSVFNATDTPHGFAIAGLGIETVLQPKKETEVTLPPLQGGHAYRIHCQLHGAHRSGTLVVLPGD
jgi:heme/copper-type cytochrome/quinol oxidase subunit 2